MADQTLDYSSLSGLAPELAEMLASIASDVVLVMNESGVIRRVASNGSEPMRTAADSWIGRNWADTVTEETRHKVEELLRDVSHQGVSRQRQVNHITSFGIDLPVGYTAIRLGQEGPVLAVGRDLRAVAAAQQRFLVTQKEMEREYWKLRQAETRYRLLFQIASDAVLVVTADSQRIVEANRSAANLFAQSADDLIGRAVVVGLTEASAQELTALLADVRSTRRAVEINVTLARGLEQARVNATFCQTEDGDCILLRFRPNTLAPDEATQSARFASFLRQIPDAVVMTDKQGIIRNANAAFLQMAQLRGLAEAEGQWLGNWLGHPGRDMRTLLNLLATTHVIRTIDSTLRGHLGRVATVELTAVLLSEPGDASIGFIIREGGTVTSGADSREVH